jgi:hypothetical protein
LDSLTGQFGKSLKVGVNVAVVVRENSGFSGTASLETVSRSVNTVGMGAGGATTTANFGASGTSEKLRTVWSMDE